MLARCGVPNLGLKSVHFLPGCRQWGRLSPAALYLRGPTHIRGPWMAALSVTAVPKLEAASTLGQHKRRNR